MITYVFTQRRIRVIAYTLLIAIISELCFPVAAYALTGGPSQPEVQSFEPVGTSEMVDLFSGDFNYNIPLLDVGGYPINISYHSGISNDQEASWVGLGWNINPGVINRNMRGLPDDFAGEEVTKQYNMRSNLTFGLSGTFGTELIGFDKALAKKAKQALKPSKAGALSFGLGLKYNNYNGIAFDIGISPGISLGDPNKGSLNMGLGLSASSESGIGVNPSVGLSRRKEEKQGEDVFATTYSLGVGLAFNSRQGFSSFNYNAGRNHSVSSVIKNSEGVETGRSNSQLNGINGGSSISFAGMSFIPQSKLPLFNLSMSLTTTIGLAAYGIHGNVKITGYFNGQFVLNNSENQPAYGYMNTHLSHGDDDLLDFNREKDAGYTEHTPNMPLTSFNYDIYNVSGQGVGGMYRPFLGAIGTLHERKSRNFTAGLNYPGIEIGSGGVVHAGLNFSLSQSDAYNGAWTSHDDFSGNVTFQSDGGNPYYEPYYFKQAGEKTVDEDAELFNNFGGFKAVRVNLYERDRLVDKEVKAEYKFWREEDQQLVVPTGRNRRVERVKRNEMISVLKGSEAQYFGLEKEIKTFRFNTDVLSPKKRELFTLSRNRINANHISEVSVYKSEGSRYVYGIPAYNTYQKEVTFAVDAPSGSPSFISYSNNDNSTNNDRGLDHYYDATIIPAYAHSYLLTSVLSPNYVDKTGNGPSEDDLGDYTKFNYSVSYKNIGTPEAPNYVIDEYDWRTPYASYKANHNEGLRSDLKDNKASFVYGRKELWYVHSIENKEYIAFFIVDDFTNSLEARADGYDAANENGGLGSSGSRCLKKIVLYHKQDITPDGVSLKPGAIPIKTVHFKYSYELCPGTLNNKNTSGQTGKLTLKEIYFTYGKSNKAIQRGYKFDYGNLSDPNVNYAYNPKYYDRWGNFKANPDPLNDANYNAEFPYTEQSKILADQYASAWALKQIELPSGGIIKVQLESDDYAYVQDRKAMQMVRVVGSSMSNPSNMSLSQVSNCNLYEPSSIPGFPPHGIAKEPFRYLCLELPTPVTSPEDFKQRYLSGPNGDVIDHLYFKFLVNIKKGESLKTEFVPGYLEGRRLQYGLCTGSSWGTTEGGSRYVWIYVYTEPMSDLIPIGKAHPIAHAAWSFVRLNLPKIAYDQENNQADDFKIKGIIEALKSSRKQLTQILTGFNMTMRKRDIAQSFVPGKSMLRLYNPNSAKLGGGSRVKSIITDDEFAKLTGSAFYEDAEYGQAYEYKTKNEKGEVISSGVASYEPMLGGEENVFRQPVIRRETKLFVPDREHIQEEPFGESFFPSPSVGYGSVSVRSIRQTGSLTDVSRFTGTGKTVHEFYTTKDFPTRVRQTTTQAIRDKPFPLLSFLKMFSKDILNLSQGYCIELNDMNGKPKAQYVYGEGNEASPISSIKYKYKTQSGDPSQLSSSALVMSKDGVIRNSDLLGVDYDVTIDMREQTTTTRSGGLGGNLEGFIALFPIAIPMIWPDYSQEKVQYRAVVMTKVINRYGLLESVTATDETSTITTQNMVYDRQTGEVLLTKTMNEFKDPVYNMKVPAYWGYEGMGMAYLNNGVKVTIDQALSNPAAYFTKGDEIAVGADRYWVLEVSPKLLFVNHEGISWDLSEIKEDTDIKELKVLRSGRRNMQTVTMETFASLKDPMIPASQGTYTLRPERIINANAVLYDQNASIFCDCAFKPENGVYPNYNPYMLGTKGFWKVKRNYVLLTDRTQTRNNGNVNLRNDGTYLSYAPFYTPNNGGEWLSNPQNWVFTSEVSLFSQQGEPLETRDALNRYSSSVLGYRRKLTVLSAGNARYREVGFDGFEDYDYTTCEDQHFGFKEVLNNDVEIDPLHSHSGRKSIVLKSKGTSARIKRVIVPCAK